MTTGSGATSITANGTGDTVTVTATALADNAQLTLIGSANFVVNGLKGDLDAGALTGTLTVTTGDAPDNAIAITTGSAATSITANGTGDTVTVTATALTDNTQLTLVGSAAVIVTGLVGDLNASALTGSLTVTTGDASDNQIAITSGAGATSITANGAGDTVSVTANALDESKLLTIAGNAKFIVGGLTADLDASALTGALTVTVNNAGDNAVSIVTGSAATTVTGTSPGDVITIDAALLADDTLLTLSGPADFTVAGLQGNLDAGAVSGTLNVTAVDVAGLTIATGIGTNIIDASALSDGHSLTLTGSHAATVSLTAGDLDANGYSGVGLLTVNVLTNSSGSDTVSIVTGSNATTIVAAEAGDTVTVNAAALPDNTLLTLSGAGNFVVTGLTGNLDASGLTGALKVTTADNTGDNAITVTTGSGATVIDSGSAGTDTITVHAAALADGKLLTVSGQAAFVVDGLVGDLDASNATAPLTALTGDLTVTTASVAGLTIATGSGANTIHAEALTDDQVLTLIGSAAAAVFLTAGDLAAGRLYRRHYDHWRRRQ